jgi:HK97 family phage portal protein
MASGLLSRAFNRLRSIFPVLRDASGVVVNPMATQMFLTAPSLLAGMAGNSVTQPYAQHVWVYACIAAIAQNIKTIPMRFFIGPPKDQKLLANTDITRLFDRPNPAMSCSEFIQAITTYYKLCGEVFILAERETQQDIPKELWTFNPGRFKHVADKQSGLIIGWVYQVGDKKIPFDAHEIIFFRDFSPYDDYRGLSPLAVAQLSILQDVSAAQYNANFFKNDATPGGVLQAKDPLDEDEFWRIRSQWRSKHEGVDKAHFIALLEGGLEYKQIGISQKDMDFLEMRKYNREEIMAIFKVAKTELSLYENINKATSQTMDRVFWTKTLIPVMKTIEDALYNKFLYFLPGGDFYMEFDRTAIDALREDFDTLLGSAQKLFAMGVPFNNINETLGLGFEAIEGGETGYLPFNLSPIENILNPPEPTPAPAPAVPAPAPASAPAEGEKPKKGQILIRRKLDRRTYWQQYHKFQSVMERKFQPRMKRYFYEQRKEQLRLIEQHWGKAIAQVRASSDEADKLLFDSNAWNDSLKKISWQFWNNVGNEAGKILVTELGANPEQFILADTPAIDVLKDKLIKVVDINEVTRENLRDTLAEGMADLETVAELQDRVREVYNFSESRSLTIARTETGQAAAPARDAAMDMLGIERQEWTTAGDDVVREIHAVMDGEIVDRGDTFSNGLAYPSDPGGDPEEVINCRCVAAPVVEKD